MCRDAAIVRTTSLPNEAMNRSYISTARSALVAGEAGYLAVNGVLASVLPHMSAMRPPVDFMSRNVHVS